MEGDSGFRFPHTGKQRQLGERGKWFPQKEVVVVWMWCVSKRRWWCSSEKEVESFQKDVIKFQRHVALLTSDVALLIKMWFAKLDFFNICSRDVKVSFFCERTFRGFFVP